MFFSCIGGGLLDLPKDKNQNPYDEPVLPKEFLCPITNLCMNKSVICLLNNVIYDYNNIFNYIKKNGKLPTSHKLDNFLLKNDYFKFFLMPKPKLQIQIRKYLKHHNIKIYNNNNNNDDDNDNDNDNDNNNTDKT